VVKAHQFLVFTTPPNLQSAIAYGLEQGAVFFHRLHRRLQAKRDRLIGGLERAGFAVAPCAGTYFVNVDIGSVGFDGDDADFCREHHRNAGVAAIPVSAFYASEPETRLVRFCFAKPESILDDAAERLKRRFS
jgi:N-succinyldiaminopimelate aminotransferase